MQRTLTIKLFKVNYKLIVLVMVAIISGCVTPEMKDAHNKVLFNDLSCVKTFCFNSAINDGLQGVNKAMNDFAPHCMFSHVKLHQSASKNLGLYPNYVSKYIREYGNQRRSFCIQSAQNGLEEFCSTLAYEKADLRNKQKKIKRVNVNSLKITRIKIDLSEIESSIDFNCK